jgi:hypothetical protein
MSLTPSIRPLFSIPIIVICSSSFPIRSFLQVLRAIGVNPTEVSCLHLPNFPCRLPFSFLCVPRGFLVLAQIKVFTEFLLVHDDICRQNSTNSRIIPSKAAALSILTKCFNYTRETCALPPQYDCTIQRHTSKFPHFILGVAGTRKNRSHTSIKS